MRARRVWHGGGDAQKIGHTARHGRAMQKDALYVRCAMKSRIVCMNDHYYALAGPGVCHPSQGGVESNDMCLSLAEYKKMGSHARCREKPGFSCRECNREFVAGKSKTYLQGNGDGRVCEACYSKAYNAKQPAFCCVLCAKEVPQGHRSYPHGDGDGRMCATCYRKRRLEITQGIST